MFALKTETLYTRTRRTKRGIEATTAVKISMVDPEHPDAPTPYTTTHIFTEVTPLPPRRPPRSVAPVPVRQIERTRLPKVKA